MLTYIVTVAISAFFVPHYLAVFWEPLGQGPGRRHLRHRPGRLPGAAQHQGHGGVGAAQPGARDRRPADPDRAGRDRARCSSSTRTCSSTQIDLGTVPSWGDFAARDRGRDGRLHRDRDDLEHVRGGARAERARSPVGPASGAGGGRPLRLPAGDRALGDAGDRGARTASSRPSSATTYADDPVLGIVENIGLSAGAHRRPARLRRRARRGDPADRDQCGADRPLAADLLDGPAPPAARDAAPGPPAVQDPVHRDHRLLRWSRRW